MKTYRVIIRPETAFATPIVGDTLFGQMCWAIVELFGESRLESYLQGYLDNDPFMVISNAFVKDHLLLPSLPSFYWNNDKNTDRKVLKGQRWIQESSLAENHSCDWQQCAKSDANIAPSLLCQSTQMHNTLNRESGSTGTGQFAPFESGLTWLNQEKVWQIFVLMRENALTQQELTQVITHVGLMGYGRDASIGLGKFSIESITEQVLPAVKGQPNAYLTLANTCPQAQGFVAEKSFYLTHTRFGRHGNVMATSGAPFKKPILMADVGAVFTPEVFDYKQFIGRGISEIAIDQKTVHQGYAPVININIDFNRFNMSEG